MMDTIEKNGKNQKHWLIGEYCFHEVVYIYGLQKCLGQSNIFVDGTTQSCPTEHCPKHASAKLPA